MNDDAPELRTEVRAEIDMHVHQLLTDGGPPADTTIRTIEQLLCDGDQAVGVTTTRLRTTWIYQLADPYALCMQIHHGAGQVTDWYLSRDSLIAAVSNVAELSEPHGDAGLVTFGFAEGDVTVLTLSPHPSPASDFTFATHDLIELIVATEELVPQGDEAALVEAVLTHGLEHWLTTPRRSSGGSR